MRWPLTCTVALELAALWVPSHLRPYFICPGSLSCAHGRRRQKELEAICSPVMTKMYQGGGAGARPAHMLLACCQPAQAAASDRLAGDEQALLIAGHGTA